MAPWVSGFTEAEKDLLIGAFLSLPAPPAPNNAQLARVADYGSEASANTQWWILRKKLRGLFPASADAPAVPTTTTTTAASPAVPEAPQAPVNAPAPAEHVDGDNGPAHTASPRRATRPTRASARAKPTNTSAPTPAGAAAATTTLPPRATKSGGIKKPSAAATSTTTGSQAAGKPTKKTKAQVQREAALRKAWKSAMTDKPRGQAAAYRADFGNGMLGGETEAALRAEGLARDAEVLRLRGEEQAEAARRGVGLLLEAGELLRLRDEERARGRRGVRLLLEAAAASEGDEVVEEMEE